MAGLKTKKREPEKRRTCDRCGRMGHVSECPPTVSERAHDMIGVEIAGYWKDLRGASELAHKTSGSRVKSDGSLTHSIGCEDQCGESSCGVCGCSPGEICTRPGSLGEAARQVTTLYPDATDDKASMHVHVSFKSGSSIALLACDAFFAHWKARWEAWGTEHKVATDSAFWKRLRGQNTYCKVNAPGSASVAGAVTSAHHADRYHQINFTAFAGHRTVEFRLLPMFQSCALGVSALEELIAIVEDFLATATAEIVVDTGTLAPEASDTRAPIVADVSAEVSALAAHHKILPVEEIGDLVLPEDANPGAIVVPRCYARERIAELYRDLDLPELVEF